MHYLDIETVTKYPTFKDVPEREQKLFIEKFEREITDERMHIELESDPPQLGDWNMPALIAKAQENVYQKAALYAEFNKIVCISMGVIVKKSRPTNDPGPEDRKFYVKSFYGHDEKKVLTDWLKAMNDAQVWEMCAHNGRNFDFPILARKLRMYKLPLPEVLNIANKKPWEMNLHDTQDMWKFGEFKHFISLDRLAFCFGLPSPKAEFSGKMVSAEYWSKVNSSPCFDRIAPYCESDVRTLCNVHLCINGQEPILDSPPA